jgi:hypothetical protein
MAIVNPIAPSITQSGRYEPFELQVARGMIFGHSSLNIFAFTTILGSVAFAPLWEGLTGSGGNYVYPSSAVVMTLVSSSASDTAVTILIDGLDANYAPITEQVAINGTTPVDTTKSFLRINGMRNVIGNSVGAITATNGGTTYAKILAGVGDTQMSIYTVPAGYSFYQTYLQADSNTSITSGAYVKLRTYVKDNTNGGVVITKNQSVFTQAFNVPLTLPLIYPERSDIQWQLQGSGGAGAAANMYIGGILIKRDGSL